MSRPNFWHRYVDGVIRFRWLILTVFVVAFGWFGNYLGKNLENFDNALGIWFEDDDPLYIYYDNFKREFESDEMAIVTVEAPVSEGSVFTERMLRLVDRVSQAMEGVRDIEKVHSLTAQNVVQGAEGALIIEPVIDLEGEVTPEALIRAREKALGEETMVGFLVSKDAQIASVAGRIISVEDQKVKHRIVDDLQAAVRPIEAEYPDVRFIYSGQVVFDTVFDELSVRDGKIFLPITLGLVCLVLLVLFRRPTMAFIPVLVMFAVIAFTWGAYFLVGNTMNMAFQMTGSILIAACIADSVHILGHYYGTVRPGISKIEAIRETVSEVVRPCFYTSATTCAGFMSFLTSRVPPLRNLGLYAGVGTMAAFVITILVIPAVMSLLPMPTPEKARHYHEGWTHRLLKRLGDINVRHTGRILLVSAVLFVISCWGLTRVQVEGNTIEFIPEGHWVRQAIFFIQEKMGGLASFDVVFEGPPDLAKDPEFLRKLDRLQAQILEDPNVSNSFSHVNYLKDMNRILHDGDPAYDAVPETSDAVAQYLLLAETSGDEDIGRFVNYDYSKVRITSRARTLISKAYLAMVDRVNRLIDETESPGIRGTLTGIVPLYAVFDRYILQSQMQSLIQAFFVITIFMCLLTRSVKIGLLSMIPNVLPIFLTLAIMGWMNIKLDAATVMIASIALGIAVDDTIHFVTRFRVELDRNGWDYEKTMRESLRIAGKPMFFTSVILLAGFGVLVLGSFKPTRIFGLLTGLTMAFALVGDLILMEAILLKLKPWGTRPVPETETQGAVPLPEPDAVVVGK